MDLKNLPVTPLPTVKLDEQQQNLLEHNRLFGTLLGESLLMQDYIFIRSLKV